MAKVPEYEMIAPWQGERAKVRIRGEEYDVVVIYMLGRRYWRALQNGQEVAITSKFTATLRALDRLAARRGRRRTT